MDDFLSLQHFHFIRPYWLFLLVTYLWILRAFHDRDDSMSMWRDVMSPKMLQHLTIMGNNTHWLSPQRLMLYLMVLICLVLMGPSWKQVPSPFSEDKAALVVALDVSASMAQADVQPSRLLRSKQKILELLKLRGDTKTALIAFSGSAHVVMPITNDSEMIRHFLDALDEQIMPHAGKAPEAVLPLAQELLSRENVPGTLLLIGDGITAGSADEFESFFSSNTHQLLVWAIGNRDLATDEQSSWTPVQFSALADLASRSGGRMISMTHDDHDVSRANDYIEHNLVIVDDGSRPWYDSGYPLLFLITPLFLFWFRRGWTLQW